MIRKYNNLRNYHIDSKRKGMLIQNIKENVVMCYCDRITISVDYSKLPEYADEVGFGYIHQCNASMDGYTYSLYTDGFRLSWRI